MEAILFGLAVNLLTRISGKFGVSKTYVSIGLCLLAGAIYYTMITYFSATWNDVLVFIGGCYASSQFVYNILKKFGVLQ